MQNEKCKMKNGAGTLYFAFLYHNLSQNAQ